MIFKQKDYKYKEIYIYTLNMELKTKEIIQQINHLLNPKLSDAPKSNLDNKWNFDKDYGFSIPIHGTDEELDNLDILFFKKNPRWHLKKKLSKNLSGSDFIKEYLTEEDAKRYNQIEKIQGVHKFEIFGTQYYEIYIMVTLSKHIVRCNNYLVGDYDSYLLFQKDNLDKIDKIYDNLNGKVPKDFISFKLYGGTKYDF